MAMFAKLHSNKWLTDIGRTHNMLLILHWQLYFVFWILPICFISTILSVNF